MPLANATRMKSPAYQIDAKIFEAGHNFRECEAPNRATDARRRRPIIWLTVGTSRIDLNNRGRSFMILFQNFPSLRRSDMRRLIKASRMPGAGRIIQSMPSGIDE